MDRLATRNGSVVSAQSANCCHSLWSTRWVIPVTMETKRDEARRPLKRQQQQQQRLTWLLCVTSHAHSEAHSNTHTEHTQLNTSNEPTCRQTKPPHPTTPSYQAPIAPCCRANTRTKTWWPTLNFPVHLTADVDAFCSVLLPQLLLTRSLRPFELLCCFDYAYQTLTLMLVQEIWEFDGLLLYI